MWPGFFIVFIIAILILLGSNLKQEYFNRVSHPFYDLYSIGQNSHRVAQFKKRSQRPLKLKAVVSKNYVAIYMHISPHYGDPKIAMVL